MPRRALHKFEHGGKRFVIDPETCFCFECDEICWDVLEHYPHETANRILKLLEAKHDRKELQEVAGELEWLRATKSILKAPQKEDLMKMYEVDHGLKVLSVALPRDSAASTQARWFARKSPVISSTARETGIAATSLLLGRAGAQKNIRIQFIENGRAHNPDLLAELCAHAHKAATLAGKTLTATVRVTNLEIAKLPETLQGHTLDAELEMRTAENARAHIRALANAAQSLPKLAKALAPDAKDVGGRIIVTPGNPAFENAAQALDEAGFTGIAIDLDAAYVKNPDLEQRAMTDAMESNARYYAEKLLKHHYFRLDPIATLFWRIYSGLPRPRHDTAGTNEIALTDDGKIYPSALLAGNEEFCLGNLADATLDQTMMRSFEDVGALTTAPCIACWARNLCGGGCTATHHALTGSIRTPQTEWCDAQRAWMQCAVSAFQMLSSAGVHFDRVYKVLGRREKPSLFALAKAALTMSIGVRPIEEADAELLTKWENWSESAYFLANEYGVLLATEYDREMDSLHPRGIDQELMLLRKSGAPFGLLKLRPVWVEGAVLVWLYMHDEADYAADNVRKSFRAILKEAAGKNAINKIAIPVSLKEEPLAQFLETVGFTQIGTMREAMYLHGDYQDINMYAIAPGDL